MKRLFLRVGTLILFYFAAFAHAEALLLGGTGAATGAMRLFSEAFEQHDKNVQTHVYPSLGSSGGVRALAAGKLHVAFTSRAPTEHELAHGLRAYPILRTPFIFATHPDANIDNINPEDIADIYAGALTHWPSGALIRPVLRPMDDSDTRIVMSLSPHIKQALASAHGHAGKNIAATDVDCANDLERIKGAFGTSTNLLYHAEQRKFKVLTYNGIAATADNMARGAYPFGKTIFLIMPEAPSASALRFLDFMRSKTAAQLIRQLDSLPAATRLSSTPATESAS